MKSVFVMLIILIVGCFVFYFPILDKDAQNVYVVCEKSNIADSLLKNSEKWQADNYFIYKLHKNDYNVGRFIPNSQIIKEYIINENNNFKCNPLMQSVFSGGQTVVGIPYVID